MGDEGADGLLAEREPPFALGAAAQDAELLLDDGRVVASLDDAAAALGGGGVAGAVVGGADHADQRPQPFGVPAGEVPADAGAVRDARVDEGVDAEVVGDGQDVLAPLVEPSGGRGFGEVAGAAEAAGLHGDDRAVVRGPGEDRGVGVEAGRAGEDDVVSRAVAFVPDVGSGEAEDAHVRGPFSSVVAAAWWSGGVGRRVRRAASRRARASSSRSSPWPVRRAQASSKRCVRSPGPG